MTSKDKKETQEQNTPAPATDSEQQVAGKAPVAIHAQYIKDLSFENPHAPHTLMNPGAAPKMDINFSMDARKIENTEEQADLYEVVLAVNATATREGQTMYIAEIEYAVVCSLQDIPEEQIHPVLLIEIPRLSFPFVRQILASISQQAGFPPLLLAPVDFRAFYLQRYGQQQKTDSNSATA